MMSSHSEGRAYTPSPLKPARKGSSAAYVCAAAGAGNLRRISVDDGDAGRSSIAITPSSVTANSNSNSVSNPARFRPIDADDDCDDDKANHSGNDHDGGYSHGSSASGERLFCFAVKAHVLIACLRMLRALVCRGALSVR